VKTGPGLLDLSPGARLLLGGSEVLVEWVEPQHSLVMLCGQDGQRHQRSVRSLVNDPDCRPAANGGLLAVDRGRQPACLEDLPAARREQLGLRVAHLLEMETGFRSGDPRRPLPGEPRLAMTLRPRRWRPDARPRPESLAPSAQRRPGCWAGSTSASGPCGGWRPTTTASGRSAVRTGGGCAGTAGIA